MKAQYLFALFMLGLGTRATVADVQPQEYKQHMNLTEFTQELFWEEPPEGLFEVEVGLNKPEYGSGDLMAFADLNSDKYTDIITVSDDKTSFSIHIFNKDINMFKAEETYSPAGCLKITNVVVGRSQELLRLFVTCNIANQQTVVKLYDRKDLGTLVFIQVEKSFSIQYDSQPHIADYNGDYLEDIMYTDKTGHQIKIAYQTEDPYTFYTLPFKSSMPVHDSSEGCRQDYLSDAVLSTPHSASLVDFDGDCISDLFITVTSGGKSYYEIYLRRERVASLSEVEDEAANKTTVNAPVKGLNSYCLIARQEVPDYSGNLFTFSDIDRDGMIDMLYTNHQNMDLTIHYNKLLNAQREQEKYLVSDTVDQLSSKTQKMAFGIKDVCSSTTRPINLIKDIYLTPQEAISSPESKFVVKKSLNSNGSYNSIYQADSSLPGRIHIGDITSDGYPDIIVTFKSSGGSVTKIFMNEKCNQSNCSKAATKAKRRFFSDQNIDQYNQILANYPKASYAAFFDLIEDSMVDILIVSQKPNNEAQSQILAIYNNIDRTQFFLKARMLTDDIVGTAVSGATIKCVLTDLDDEKFIATSGQTGQTAFHSLASPYTHFGIGRSNNFVEKFTVIIPVNGQRVMHSWSPVIPKSILFVDSNMSHDGNNWKLDTLVKPSEKIPIILLVDGVVLLLLGLVIIVLHFFEKAEDQKENEQVRAFDYF